LEKALPEAKEIVKGLRQEVEIVKLAVNPDKKYLDCIKRFPLKPIRTEEENELAAQICDQLLEKVDSLSAWERDYLDVLSDLVEHFESQWQEENNVEPRELLSFLMEQNNLTQTDLIPEFGTSSRASEFLSGKRDLSLPQVLKLADRFKLSPTAFLPSHSK
jgi:HTH-type transcriptional regulator/antitoxin HigA